VVTNDILAESDGFVFGVSTRYGMMAAQVKQMLDATGGLWSKGALIGKPAGVMASTATQHGGQEIALLSTAAALMHHGLVIVGLPYSFDGQMGVDEVKGGSPYGATTIAGGDGARMPSEVELAAARFHGRRVAEVAVKLGR
jgi:NAD(P)H dehydrogenase (quinone)